MLYAAFQMNFPLFACIDSGEETPYLLPPTACFTLWAWGRNTANSCSPSEGPPALLALPPALKYFLPLHCSSLYGFCKLKTWKAIKLFSCYCFRECNGSSHHQISKALLFSSDFRLMPSIVALTPYLKYNILGPREMLKVQFIFHLRPWWASSLSDSEARVDIEILDTFENHKSIPLSVNCTGWFF